MKDEMVFVKKTKICASKY